MPEIPATLPPEQKRSRLATLLRPKVAIPVFLLVLVLLSPVIIRGWRLRDVPDVPEPFDPEPLLSLEIPDDENASTDYRAATALFIPSTDHVYILVLGTETYDYSPKGTFARRGILEDGWHLADEEVKQWLQDNEKSLLQWRQGTRKSEALHVNLRNLEIATNLDLPQQMKEFNRIVMVLCRKLEAEGKYEEAWHWYRAAIRASRHTGANGREIERLIGISHFTLIVNQLEDWSALPDVSAELLRKAIREIQEDWKLTVPASNNIKIEYISMMNTIASGIAPVKDWPVVFPAASSTRTVPWSFYLKGEPELGVSLLRIDFYNTLLYCDQFPFERLRRTSSDYEIPPAPGSQADQITTISDEEFYDLTRKSPLAAALLPALNQSIDAIDREEIKCRTLLVTFAGQAFYRDQGRFPDYLDELVPDYLDKIPLDTFDGKPLKYRYDPDGPVVYSVFENFKDNGGVEWNFQNCRDPAGPDDLGFQMRIPGIKPLRADKPLSVEGDNSK